MTPRILLFPLFPLLLLAATACGEDGPDAASDDASSVVASAPVPSAAPAEDAPSEDAPSEDAPAEGAATVTIEQSRFSERELVVPVGTTVTFINLDGFAHTVTSSEDSPLAFDSGTMNEGAEFTVTFDEPGTYAYFCEVHPTMRATVVVQ